MTEITLYLSDIERAYRVLINQKTIDRLITEVEENYPVGSITSEMYPQYVQEVKERFDKYLREER